MGTGAVVGMVLAIVGGVTALNVLVWLPILRKLKRMPDELRAELAHETIVAGPDRAAFAGATKSFGKVSGLGIAVLTKERFVFRKAIGKQLVIPRAEISTARLEQNFMGRRGRGHPYLVLMTTDGADVGFVFDDATAEKWLSCVSGSAPA